MELEGCGSILALLFVFGSWLFQALVEGRRKRARQQQEEAEEPLFESFEGEPESADTGFDTLRKQLREIGLDLEMAEPEPETQPSATSPPPPPPPTPVAPYARDRRPSHTGHDHVPLQEEPAGSIQDLAPPPLLDQAPKPPKPGRDRALEAARQAPPPSAAELGERVTEALAATTSRKITTLRPSSLRTRKATSNLAAEVARELRSGPESLARAIVLKEILGRPVALQPERDLPSSSP